MKTYIVEFLQCKIIRPIVSNKPIINKHSVNSTDMPVSDLNKFKNKQYQIYKTNA